MVSAFVIPFVRLPRTLEGFDYEIPTSLKEDVMQGSIVQIPLRNKKIWGFVEDIRPSSYTSLKPIIGVSDPVRIISAKDRALMKWFSDYYCVSRGTGALQWAPFFLQPYHSSDHTLSLSKQNENMYVAQLIRYVHEKDRIACLLSLIEYARTKEGQILILLPTIGEVERTARELNTLYTDLICIHSALKASVLRQRTVQAAQGIASIIIGTRLAVFTPLPNLACIVLDEQERIEYKQYDANPRYDARDVALHRAKIEKKKIAFLSVAPRLEDMQSLPTVLKKNDDKKIACQVVGLEEEFRNKNYSFISDVLQNKIQETLARKKNVFLVLNRTGYSRMVSCTTCQYVFSCEQCMGAPRYSSQNATLVCSQCDISRNIPSQCPVCQGHEYTFPGLGIEKITASIKKIFGEDVHSSIIVETSFAFLQNDILNLGLLGFIACDPVLSISDFRSWERQWQSYAGCIERAISLDGEVLIQAITPSSVFIQSLAHLDYSLFAQGELSIRKKGNWPPYSRLIKIMQTRSSKIKNSVFNTVISDVESLKKNPDMPPYSVIPLSKQKKQTSWTEVLIKIDSPYEQGASLPYPLKEYIKKLPEGIIVDIDPLEL